MIKPTEAQIEAVKGKLGVTAIARIIFDNLSDIDGDNADWLYYRENLETAAEQIIALTSAAEVGEDKSAYVEALNFAHAYDRGSKEATAATIERCAQVVRRFLIAPDADIEADRKVRKIIDAIRALKDQP